MQPQYSKEFEDWWKENGVTSAIPTLMNSYKEMAWKGWQAGYDVGYDEGYQNGVAGDGWSYG